MKNAKDVLDYLKLAALFVGFILVLPFFLLYITFFKSLETLEEKFRLRTLSCGNTLSECLDASFTHDAGYGTHDRDERSHIDHCDTCRYVVALENNEEWALAQKAEWMKGPHTREYQASCSHTPFGPEGLCDECRNDLVERGYKLSQ